MTEAEMIAEIKAFLDVWPNAEFGPAHIVLSDHNVGDGHLSWCDGILWAVRQARIAGVTRYDVAAANLFYEWHSDAELEATQLLIQALQGVGDVRIEPGRGVVSRGWRDVPRGDA